MTWMADIHFLASSLAVPGCHLCMKHMQSPRNLLPALLINIHPPRCITRIKIRLWSFPAPHEYTYFLSAHITAFVITTHFHSVKIHLLSRIFKTTGNLFYGSYSSHDL